MKPRNIVVLPLSTNSCLNQVLANKGANARKIIQNKEQWGTFYDHGRNNYFRIRSTWLISEKKFSGQNTMSEFYAIILLCTVPPA